MLCDIPSQILENDEKFISFQLDSTLDVWRISFALSFCLFLHFSPTLPISSVTSKDLSLTLQAEVT